MKEMHEQIFEIADELVANGKKPTLDKVRAVLGGGSFTTISKVMQEWRAKNSPEEHSTNEPAPQFIAELLSKFGVELWSHSLQMANARFAAEREVHENDLNAIEMQRQEATDWADRVIVEIEKERRESAILQERFRFFQCEASGVSDQLRDRQRDLAVAHARIEEMTKQIAQLRHLLDKSALHISKLVAFTDPNYGKSINGLPEVTG